MSIFNYLPCTLYSNIYRTKCSISLCFLLLGGLFPLLSTSLIEKMKNHWRIHLSPHYHTAKISYTGIFFADVFVYI